jgi:diguanylate cyclase (GGDEF)-like protein
VILANVSQDAVAAVAERVRVLVASSSLSHPERISVTVSIGAAVVRAGESTAQLVRRADENLYRAKREGRNTVRTDGDPQGLSIEHHPSL